MLYLGNNNEISLTRGDTAFIQVPIERVVNGEVSPYEVQESDTLFFSVKEDFDSPSYLFQKKLVGTNKFKIDPVDTKAASFNKRYKYDVQLCTATGDVYTVIPPATFKILPEVTLDECNV